jgi:hypothetical protein
VLQNVHDPPPLPARLPNCVQDVGMWENALMGSAWADGPFTPTGHHPAAPPNTPVGGVQAPASGPDLRFGAPGPGTATLGVPHGWLGETAGAALVAWDASNDDGVRELASGGGVGPSAGVGEGWKGAAPASQVSEKVRMGGRGVVVRGCLLESPPPPPSLAPPHPTPASVYT